MSKRKRRAVGMRRISSKRRRNLRKRVILQFNGKCVYCSQQLVDIIGGEIVNDDGTATIDHIIPQSRGGSNSFENFTLACADCNKQKGNNIEWVENPI